MDAHVPETAIENYVRRLDTVTRADVAQVGAKAANLGELTDAGFMVPHGFVLTTRAFESFVAANHIDAGNSTDTLAAAQLPRDVAAAIQGIARAFGDVPVAVRSSGVAEDLAGASFAGQYETVLDVRGSEALEAAVRHCWASAFGERVAAYRAGMSDAARRMSSSMAVLVQRLVPADAAGVAFSANPVTGDRSETVVSAVRGLGDRLVSGQASPDEWLVREQQAICRAAPEGAIEASQACEVADLARQVEHHFGSPQDIEWALAGGKLYLLQARPITSLPSLDREGLVEAMPEPVVPPGFWERNSTIFPRPLTPMSRSIVLPSLDSANGLVLREVGALAETLEWREIGGWVYTSLIPFDRKYGQRPPSWLMPLLIRIVPKLRARIRKSVEYVRSNLSAKRLQQWYDEWKPSLIARIAELHEVDFTTLTDEGLDVHMERALRLSRDAADIHFLLHGAIGAALSEMAFTCRDLLGWDERRTFELFAGLSAKSTEPARHLSELAQMAAERPAVRSLLDKIDDDVISRLPEIDAEFAADFDAYQREFGCRALRYEVDYLTLSECPELVLGLIRDQMARGYDPQAEDKAQEQRRATALAEARAALAFRSTAERQHFETALPNAERAYPVREDMEFYTVSAPLAVIRYAILELGQRLAEQSVIMHRDDVFFLEVEEAREALRKGGDRRALVERRRAERNWIQAHPGPASYGKDSGPQPSLSALPPETRSVNESLLWVVEHVLGQKGYARRQVAGSVLTGLAVSPGQYAGPACVVMDESQFGKLRPGDVLVCPITSPVWSVLFPSIGALVTDTGGVLSHPAIIAREYRVPAVVSTGNATQLLRDGQIVTVDGTAGTVEVQS